MKEISVVKIADGAAGTAEARIAKEIGSPPWADTMQK